MRKLLFAVAAYAMMFQQAHAIIITESFNDWKAAPVAIGDKVFTYLAGGGTFNNPTVTFTETIFPTQTIYTMDIAFSPALHNVAVDLDYSVAVTNPLTHITGMGIDSQVGSLGTNFNVTKTFYSSPGHVGQIAQLVSVNGSNSSVLGDFGQLVFTHVEATVPVGNVMDSFRDEYTQALVVPEPPTAVLAGLGLVAAFSLNWMFGRRRTTKLAA